MAASLTGLGDLEERFFTCSFCLDSLKEPKLLPCLHRYCRECLHKIIANKKGTVNCPLCNGECVIPPGGANGFKTDFFVKSVVECLQLENSYKQDNVRPCHGCKQTTTVTGYCFKCRNFLCHQCYQFHINNDIVEEHRPHLLDLKTVDVRRLTLKKLASLAEDPRCEEHVKRLAEMCCETCDNLPICVACIYGKHKGHVTHEVGTLAASERGQLETTVLELGTFRDRLYELPKRVEKVRKDLAANVKEQLQKARAKHQEALKIVESNTDRERGKLEEQRKEILARKEKECDQVRMQLEEEITELRVKYSKILQEKEQGCQTEVDVVDGKTRVLDDDRSAKVGRINHQLDCFEQKVKESQENNESQISNVADHTTRTVKRYEEFTATATTVLQSNDEWTEAQCLPAIRAAGELLEVDVKKEARELESLSDTGVKDLLFGIVDRVTVSEGHESLVYMKGIGIGWQVCGITSSSDGQIIVTGWAGRGKSHITVINREGRVARQDQLEGAAGSSNPVRYCQQISQNLTATVCSSNQVGIFDILDGKHVKKDIGDMNVNWPGVVTCVATDNTNNIYVGSDGRDVLVLDDQLNHRYTIKLPEIIISARDIAVHGNNLIVCDSNGKGAYAVAIRKGKTDIIRQFTGPDGKDSRPCSVCIDGTNHIYILWYEPGTRVLTQYSQDDRQLLTTRRVDEDARCLTILVTEKGEMLLIATRETKKLYTLGLTQEIKT